MNNDFTSENRKNIDPFAEENSSLDTARTSGSTGSTRKKFKNNLRNILSDAIADPSRLCDDPQLISPLTSRSSGKSGRLSVTPIADTILKFRFEPCSPDEPRATLAPSPSPAKGPIVPNELEPPALLEGPIRPKGTLNFFQFLSISDVDFNAIDLKQPEYSDFIHKACKHGLLGTVQKIKKYFEIKYSLLDFFSVYDSRGNLPIHHAVYNGNLNIVKYLVSLVSAGEVDYVDWLNTGTKDLGYTPFLIAVSQCNIPMVKYFLSIPDVIDHKKMLFSNDNAWGILASLNSRYTMEEVEELAKLLAKTKIDITNVNLGGFRAIDISRALSNAVCSYVLSGYSDYADFKK
jgi:hypothetical protein